ncbi:hypothetical protein [Kutzneria buriramensis]|uniref:Uncharacterized protein n=1 Tax=Kutzneria buriramensis TaxID=1045776 RepID=A0A3E0H7I9_9PSEU|nr:hypothetical protein [Kutzneria buriramensis]REH39411.1 hypothetical protein BCF44_113266 [Kutzneria buriramensis]
MSPTQTIVCTALPNGVGVAAGAPVLKLSVHIAPRLSGATDLSSFPDWQNWPRTAISFQVKVNGATLTATADTSKLSATLWPKLFPASTKVEDHTGPTINPADTYVRTYPARRVRNFVRDQYAYMAANSPTSHPTLGDYFDQGGEFAARFPQPLNFLLHDVWLDPVTKKAAIEDLRLALAFGHFFDTGQNTLRARVNGAHLTDYQTNFLLAELFHDRNPANNPGGGSQTITSKSLEQPKLDFHAVVGSLGQYPELMRRLGLVRDVTVPLPNPLPTGIVDVQVIPGFQPAITPVTRCVITATSFLTAPRGDALAGGLLQLGGPDFDVTEIDPDGAAVKMLAFAETMSRTSRGENRNGKPAVDSPDEQPPPSLVSNGLSINDSGRGRRIYDAITKQVNLGTTGVVFAEDVTRGVRIDVWDTVSKAWHSLCQRQGSYAFADTTVNAADEGIVTSAHTTQAADTANVMYMHETIATWHGYSLVAPRPGKAIADDGSLVPGGSTDPGADFNLKVAFKATPGTLPKLRFGRGYRFRARLADLAGNGVRLEDVKDFTGATDPVVYYRFEPVQAPTLLLRKARTEGESTERLVIRSNYNAPSTDGCERHLAPVRIAELMAEQHGMFDVPANILNPSGMDKLAYGQIKQRDTGSFATGGAPGAYDIPYYDTPQLTVPYLPDVLSRGAAFVGLPGTADGQVVTNDFGRGLLGWPDILPFRLRIEEGTGAPQPGLGVLTVQVPKGRRYEVRYSSRVNASDLAQLGQWNWLANAVADGSVVLPPGATMASMQDLAVKGQLWLLTPFRTLTLVHAIRQPLTTAEFGKPIAVRKQGQTTANIVDRVAFDRASTSKIDVLASWQEALDVPADPAPQHVPGATQAFEVVTVEDDTSGDVQPLNNQHEFHDTKHRMVTYTPVATTRFAEYFVQRTTVELGGTATISTAGIVPGTDVVRDTTTNATYVRDTDYSVDYLHGTVTAITIPANTSVEVAYVVPPITRNGTAVTVNVPSSARPAAPLVAYVVPTFGWEQENSATGITSTRRGNGLRVFLNRPWYSSGDGEQLGVLTMNQAGPVPGDLQRYVTNWAQDPAWESTAFTRPPLVTDFPLAAHTKTGLKLAESEKDPNVTDTVSVAPHDVFYDNTRRLWYCDITLAPPDPSPYSPFIRLALARYQPNSVADVELSQVTQAQFAQLNPDRALSVAYVDATRIDVAVTGISPKNSTGNRVFATVQVADPALPGDVAWSDAAPAVELTNSGAPGRAQWLGRLTLPAARGSRPFRLVIQENEQFKDGGSRVVYVDAVQL